MGRLVVLLIVLLWLGWTLYATYRFLSLKRLIAGSENPVFLLSRGERRAHARKLLQREDDEYFQQWIDKNTRYIQEGNQN